MATLNIFASFEFDKDDKLRRDFYGQAKNETNHKIRDCSLRESYPDDEWKQKANDAISVCDVVVVLIGQDTHSAEGVIEERCIARDLNKPIFQVRNQRSNYGGLAGLSEPIPWRWEAINEKLDEIADDDSD